MKNLTILFLLFSSFAYADNRECKWDKKWEIIIPEKNISCPKVDTRTFLLYWSGDNVTMKNCKIQSGTWRCYYSNKIYNLKTKKEVSKMLQIDHMLPWHELKNRGILKHKNPCIAYNDVENLIVVSATENRNKSDFVIKPLYLRTNDTKHLLHYYKNNYTWHTTKKHLFKDLQNASCEICKKYQLLYCEDFCD